MEVSFMDALRARYAASDDSNTYDADAFLVGDPSRRRNKKWEFVGMEKVRAKQSRLDRLEHVELRAMHIRVAFHRPQASDPADSDGQERNEITEANLQRLRAVDLSENEELRLAEVGRLVHHLPLLETLQLCDIPFLLTPPFLTDADAETHTESKETKMSAPTSSGTDSHAHSDAAQAKDDTISQPHLIPARLYPAEPPVRSVQLTKLVLNHAGVVSCFQLCVLMELPHLHELHLDQNNLYSLDMYASAEEATTAEERGLRVVLPQVRTLSLAHNHLSAWIDEDEEYEEGKEEVTDMKMTAADTRHDESAEKALDKTKDDSGSVGSESPQTRLLGRHDGVTAHTHRHVKGRARGGGLCHTLTRVFPALRELYVGDNNLPNLIVDDAALVRDARQRMEQLAVPATGTSANTQTSETGNDAAALGKKKDPAASESRYAFLGSLTLLHINDNSRIDSSRSIDAIRVLCPELKALRVSYSHLFPHWNESIARMFVLASLPALTTLNRGDIRAKERLDADVLYIQRGLAQRSAHTEDHEKHKDDEKVHYPLLDVLREKHKDLVLSIYREGDSALSSGDGDAHVMLTLSLRCENCYTGSSTRRAGGAGAQRSRDGTIRKTLPSTMTIDKLKALIRVLFHVDPVNQMLTSQTSDAGVLTTPVELSNEMRTLSFYGVSDGDIITVRDSSLR